MPFVSKRSLLFAKHLSSKQSNAFNQCDCEEFNQCDCFVPYSHYDYSVITFAYIELTPSCNNHCAGCGNVFVSDKPSRKTDTDNAGLSLHQWDMLIEKLPSRLTHVNITGGEPTLSPYFDEFISMIDKKGLSFTLFTNARWNKSQEILSTLLSSKGLKGLLISLHGKDAFTHEAFTQA